MTAIEENEQSEEKHFDYIKGKIGKENYFDNKDNENIRELWANFLDCIKSGKRPVCDIEIGHNSTAMSLLGMLSLKLGRSVRWDGAKNAILGDAEASKLLRRDYRAPWKYPEL